MKIFFILYLVVILIDNSPVVNCYRSNDFCKKASKKMCKAFDCGTDFCAKDNDLCCLIQWMSFLQKKTELYTNFTENIRICKKYDYEYYFLHRLSYG